MNNKDQGPVSWLGFLKTPSDCAVFAGAFLALLALGALYYGQQQLAYSIIAQQTAMKTEYRYYPPLILDMQSDCKRVGGPYGSLKLRDRRVGRTQLFCVSGRGQIAAVYHVSPPSLPDLIIRVTTLHPKRNMQMKDTENVTQTDP